MAYRAATLIHQAHLEGIFGKGERWISAGEMDTETRWQDVPGWKLESGFSAMGFLDDEGWLFYLPAFMCWTLRNWRATRSPTPEYVIWSLDTSDPHQFWRFEKLNRAQSEAVYDFLEFFERYSSEHDSGAAIRAYWHRFKE